MIYIYEISKGYFFITKEKRKDKLIYKCLGKCEFKGSDEERALRRKKRQKYEDNNKAYRKEYNRKYYEKTRKKKRIGI